jgi:hypothetical protein
LSLLRTSWVGWMRWWRRIWSQIQVQTWICTLAWVMWGALSVVMWGIISRTAPNTKVENFITRWVPAIYMSNFTWLSRITGVAKQALLLQGSLVLSTPIMKLAEILKWAEFRGSLDKCMPATVLEQIPNGGPGPINTAPEGQIHWCWL